MRFMEKGMKLFQLYFTKWISVILCFLFLFALYRGCMIKQIILFENLPRVTVPDTVTAGQLVTEFAEEKNEHFAYRTSKEAIAYEIRSDGDSVEYVKIYMLSKLHGLTNRTYTWIYHPMFILSLNESEIYIYDHAGKGGFDSNLTLTGYGQAARTLQTGLTFDDILVDVYMFYPAQKDSVTMEMSKHMPYYFQLQIQGF